MRPAIFAVMVLVAVLCGLDIATTGYILANGGEEFNPFMVSAVDSGVCHIVIKWCLLLFGFAMAIYAERLMKDAGPMVAGGLAGMIGLAVVNNTACIAGAI